MNENDEKFQKWLAIYQILATFFAAAGAVFITFGLTWTQFGLDSSMNTTEIDNSTKAIQTFTSSVRETGSNFMQAGVVVLVISLIFALLIWKEKSKPKLKKSGQAVLFDEMYDGKDIELGQRGYDAYSVKKLRLTGEPLQYDYSVLKYAEENKMILITEDPENYGGCQENNLPCIKLGQNPSIEEIVKALESLKADYDSKKS